MVLSTCCMPSTLNTGCFFFEGKPGLLDRRGKPIFKRARAGGNPAPWRLRRLEREAQKGRRASSQGGHREPRGGVLSMATAPWVARLAAGAREISRGIGWDSGSP